jgi:hypothetical protein
MGLERALSPRSSERGRRKSFARWQDVLGNRVIVSGSHLAHEIEMLIANLCVVIGILLPKMRF